MHEVLQHGLMRAVIRKAFTFIGGCTVLPVLYLNVETVATEHGWGSLLSSFLETNAGGLLQFALHPWTVTAAIAISAFLSGLWLDSWARARDFGHPTKEQIEETNRQNLCNQLARIARKAENAVRFGSEDGNETIELLSIVFILLSDLEKDGYAVPKVSQAQGTKKLAVTARYFRTIVPFIAAGRIEEAKKQSVD